MLMCLITGIITPNIERGETNRNPQISEFQDIDIIPATPDMHSYVLTSSVCMEIPQGSLIQHIQKSPPPFSVSYLRMPPLAPTPAQFSRSLT